ncbi:aspartyl/asparaginyl beta-hydroxylase domain-containing protein (plasmid) [Streptomyces sp. AHU1]|uniref:aspartyl/asparaginyl beta-hydroxylase domain-containing protein n=1 Tax=Streptomyces sp. AHU1 TaxID=3377215 RepID=UPI003877CE67
MNLANARRRTVRRIMSAFFLKVSGGDKRFRITSPYEIFPEAREFEQQFQTIKAEVDALVNLKKPQKYSEIDPGRAAEVSTDWKIYYGSLMGAISPEARTLIPSITSFAEKSPNVVSTIVSILEPGVTLKAHVGTNGGFLRYHLTLQAPEVNAPYIRVDREEYTWREGESIILDDTFDHEVYNESDERRIVLIVDIYRPMNRFADLLNRMHTRTRRKAAGGILEASRILVAQ